MLVAFSLIYNHNVLAAFLAVCNVEHGINYYHRSTKIKETVEPSGWKACCDNCKQNSQCVSWTWAKEVPGASWSNICLLFNRIPIPAEKVADTNCISGITGNVTDGTFPPLQRFL